MLRAEPQNKAGEQEAEAELGPEMETDGILALDLLP